MKKIHPDRGDSDARFIFDTVQSLRTIFYKLTTVKNKETITSSMFEKLARDQYIKAKLNIPQCEFQLKFATVSEN